VSDVKNDNYNYHSVLETDKVKRDEMKVKLRTA